MLENRLWENVRATAAEGHVEDGEDVRASEGDSIGWRQEVG